MIVNIMTNKKEFKSIVNKLSKKTTKSDLIKQCIMLIKHRIGNGKLQKDLLRYYDLDDLGNDLVVKGRGINKAKSILARLDVSVTGAREDDILEGTSVLTRRSIIKVLSSSQTDKPIKTSGIDDLLLKIPKKSIVCQLKSFIYPEKRNLDTLRSIPSIWKQFLKKISALPFYQNMKVKEIEEWLYVNEESTHNSTVVGDTNYLQILQPGNISTKLSDEKINKLVKGDKWTSKQIESFFPKIPGSKANKHTLFLIRSFWRINIAYRITSKFTGSTLFLPFNSKTKENKSTFYVLKDIKYKGNKTNEIGISVLGNANCGSTDCLQNIKISQKELKTRDKLKICFGNLPPSFYKSLIQKIIRFRPLKVELPKYMSFSKTNKVDSEDLLISCIFLLADLSGSFVPDIQRYVTGKESCFKRLAVSIVEDGYTNKDDVATLFTAALLAQRVKSWNPNNKIYEIALKCARNSLSNNKYFGYSIKKGSTLKPIILSDKQSAMERSSSLLDELKSFATDLHMLRDTINTDIKTGHKIRPKIMFLEQAVDHHWATGITYFMDQKLVSDICKNNNSKTFAPLFSLVWKMSSGINVRKFKLDEKKFYSNDIVSKIRKAQTLQLISYHAPKKTRKPINNKKYSIEYSLNDGWLASLIGSMDVGLKPPSLVTVNPENITKFIAIRRPSRDHNEILTDEQKKNAIDKAIAKLQKGVSINAASSPILELIGAKVKLVYVKNKIKYKIFCANKNVVFWDDIKKGKQSFPILEPIGTSMKTILTNIGFGVEKNHKTSFTKLVKNTDKKILRRVVYYLSGYNAEINMNRISRDGGGIIQSVIVEDVGAYQFLLQTSKIFSGALEPKLGSLCGFKVKSVLLLDEIKNKILEGLITNNKINTEKWTNIKDNNKRKLWDHQKHLIKELYENYKNETRGAFVWLRVGMGKTLILLKHIQRLIKERALPKYIIYTLPDSSITTIISEVEMFNLKYNIIKPRKNETLRPFQINFVTSDNNLRICEKSLIKYADESLFIVDEVHKAMNDTKRTTVASNIASLSKNFVVMTGTPVIDSKTYKLISWLKMIVPYEVNDRNYLVAANNMLTRNVETGVKVLREDVEAIFLPSKLKEYNKLVPFTLGGHNTNPTYEQMRKATELCYNTCDIEMVKQVNILLKNNSNRIMLVSKDIKHQQKLYNMLIKSNNKNLKKKDIYLLESGKSIVLTDETVKKTKIDYKIVIVPIKRAEGYTLTRMNIMIRSVYPSNQATRTQIEGRINRIGQNAEEIKYMIVHVGILTNIMNNHNDAKSLELALMKMAKN